MTRQTQTWKWAALMMTALLWTLAGCGSGNTDKGADKGASSAADKGKTASDKGAQSAKGPADGAPGSKSAPLRVMLVPADGGTEQGTRADYEPLFNAITKDTGLHFNIKVGQSYNAVVEAAVGKKIDIAFFGPITYHQARQRGAVELLAVAVSKGKSVYYSGIFVAKESGIGSLTDLKGKSVAFGDVNSTSSFNFPLAMIIDAGLDPVKDLGKVNMTGSHANSLTALAAGKVDAACASVTSYEKAVKGGQIDPQKVVLLATSEPIPYPPLALHKDLPAPLKKTLKDAFNTIHTQPQIKPEMIRGYGGKKVDRYDANYPEAEFDKAMGKLAKVTENLKAELLKKATAQ